MAKKAAKAGASKSDAVRGYVGKHSDASPKAIVEGLKAEGTEVSLALASKIKYGQPGKKGTAKKCRRKQKAPAGRAAASSNGASRHGNKAEAIRVAAKSLGRKVRPRDVIAILKEQGITVSSAQVSTTLKAMGMRRTRRGRKAVAVAGPAASR